MVAISLRGQPKVREGRLRLLAPSRCFRALVMKIKSSCSEGFNIKDLLLMIDLVLSSIQSCRSSPSQPQVIEFQVPKVSFSYFPFNRFIDRLKNLNNSGRFVGQNSTIIQPKTKPQAQAGNWITNEKSVSQVLSGETTPQDGPQNDSIKEIIKIGQEINHNRPKESKGMRSTEKRHLNNQSLG